MTNEVNNEESEHGYECDARACLRRALESFQSALAVHCDESTTAEAYAILAHSEAMKTVKVVGRQPMRYGGD